MLNSIFPAQELVASKGHSTPHPQTIDFDYQAALLFTAIENLADGLLIVTQTGEVLHKNRCAQKLMQLINQNYRTLKTVPQSIWQACQALMHSQEDDLLPPDSHLILEDEIKVQSQARIRMRVQWFNLNKQDCFLVTLEDLNRSVQCSAITDAQRYGLTRREAEVWQLKRTGYSYKEIASSLYISENTVKKHLKNVYSKRDMAQCIASVKGTP